MRCSLFWGLRDDMNESRMAPVNWVCLSLWLVKIGGMRLSSAALEKLSTNSLIMVLLNGETLGGGISDSGDSNKNPSIRVLLPTL